jgi:hypothetical protein
VAVHCCWPSGAAVWPGRPSVVPEPPDRKWRGSTCQGQRNTPQTGLVSRETGFVLVAGVPVLGSRGWLRSCTHPDLANANVAARSN